MRRGFQFTLVLSFAVALTALTAPPNVAESGVTPCQPQHVDGLGSACRLPDGHYLVFLEDGETLLTHGPDPEVADAGPGFGPSGDQRPPRCADDDGYRLHVLYGWMASEADVADEIRSHIRRMNALLNADALASGDVEADYNVVCDASGEIQVDGFHATGSSDYSAVVNSAKAAGFTKGKTDYLIFYEGSSTGICGVANIYYDDRLSAQNNNVINTGYGVVYRSCWDERTPMHENAHNQGAVQRLAPMSDLNGHCLEGLDVMCYTSNFIVLCGDRIHYDCGYDTYFNAKPPSGSWLATHWNIGSRLNPYLSFSDVTPPEPKPTTEPTSEPSETTQPTSKKPGATTSRTPRSTSYRPLSTTTSAAESVIADETEPPATAQDQGNAAKGSAPGLGAFGLLGAMAFGVIFIARHRRR